LGSGLIADDEPDVEDVIRGDQGEDDQEESWSRYGKRRRAVLWFTLLFASGASWLVVASGVASA
jgi:hypothetical protein